MGPGMLYLDSPMLIRGVNVFRDYNNKSQFYFLPNSPRLAIEAGQPMFQLLVYREAGDVAGAVRGGGFLVMTTDLAVSNDRLDQVKQELSSRFGVQALLAPVPVKSGAVRVTLLDSAAASGEGGRRELHFVENIVANAAPSLYGDQRAAFTAELSRQGAALMVAALRGEGATPIVVVYDLQYVGLLPAYNVKIKIDFRQSYQYLRTRAQANTLWFKSDIDHEMEELRKSGAIEIEEVVFETQPTEDLATRQTRLNSLVKDLAQWTFFKPALNPGAVLATDRGTLQAYDSTTDMSRITAGLTSTSQAALTGVGATEDAGAPRRPGAAVATGALETAAATTTTPPSPTPAPSDEPPTAVELWNRAGRPQGAYLRRELDQDERQTIVYELRQVTAVERSIAPQGQIRMLEGASNLRGRILTVDLDSEFFKTIEGTITTSADLAQIGISSMNVKLRYGVKPDGAKFKDFHESELRAAGDRKQYRFFVDHLGTRELEYQVVLNNLPNSAIGHDASTEESPWIPTTTRNLDINPLTFSSVLRVSITAAMVDWNMVKQIQAHIRYHDQRSGISAADTKILTQQTPAALVPVRPKDPGIRDVTVAATFFYTDGSKETVTISHDGDEPFVLNQPPDTTTVVDVTLADILERYKRVSVQLGMPDATPPQVKQTVTVTPDAVTGHWAFRRTTPQQSKFAYRVTSFLKDGSIHGGNLDDDGQPAADRRRSRAGRVGGQGCGARNTRRRRHADGEAGARLSRCARAWADAHVEQLLQANTTEFTWRVPDGEARRDVLHVQGDVVQDRRPAGHERAPREQGRNPASRSARTLTSSSCGCHASSPSHQRQSDATP